MVALQKEVNIKLEGIVEIIGIGNGLLLRMIPCMSAQWLAGHITCFGGLVKSISIVVRILMKAL